MREVRWTVPAVVLSALLVCAASAAGVRDTSGTLVFATGSDGVSDKLELATVRPDGTGFRKITHLAGPGLAPKWSADGRRIVFITEDSFTEADANWRMRANGSQRQRLPGTAWDVPSPDGNLVHMYDRIVDARGKVVRRLRPGLRRDDYYSNAPLWSPNGRYIAINVARWPHDSDFIDYNWVDVIPTTKGGRGLAVTPRRKGHFAGALSWSRDSRRMLIDIARDRTDDWYTVAPDGSDRRLVLHLRTTAYRDQAWSPDSRRIAYVGANGGIFVMSAVGGRSRRVVATKSPHAEASRIYLDWSSKGELVFSDTGGTYVVRADGRGLRRLTTRRGAPYWSPNGQNVVLSTQNEIYIVSRDGPARRLTRWLSDLQPQWSPDGRRVAFVRGRGPFAQPRTVYLANADGTAQRALGAGERPTWSVDGTRIAFVERRNLPQNDRIFVSDAGGGAPREIADGDAPTWAPDGRIAFMRYRYVQVDYGERAGLQWEIAESMLVTTLADGSDAHVIFDVSTYEEGAAFAPKWSPDGGTIALLLRDSYGEGGVVLVDRSVGTSRQLTALTPDSIEWSPDGSRILAAGYLRLWVVDATTGAATKIRDGADGEFSLDDPTWSPDGTAIAFVRCISDGEVCDVYAMEARAGAQARRLTRTPGTESGLDWAD